MLPISYRMLSDNMTILKSIRPTLFTVPFSPLPRSGKLASVRDWKGIAKHHQQQKTSPQFILLPQEKELFVIKSIWKFETGDNTWRRVTAILYWAQMVAWALISAPRDWSLASARKASSKQDNASESWFCSRWASPVLKHIEAAAPRGTCYKKKHIIRKQWGKRNIKSS